MGDDGLTESETMRLSIDDTKSILRRSGSLESDDSDLNSLKLRSFRKMKSQTLSNRSSSIVQSISNDPAKFWGAFTEYPDQMKSAPEISLIAWKGLPEGWGERAQIWGMIAVIDNLKNAEKIAHESAKAQAVASPVTGIRRKPPAPPALQERIVNCIGNEMKDDNKVLENLELIASAVNVKETKELVADVHLKLGKTNAYIPGSVQMAIAIRSMVGFTFREASEFMVYLFKNQLFPWIAVDERVNVGLRTEVLVAIEFLLCHDPEIIRFLSSHGLDVSDLSDIAWLWCSPVFLYHFPMEFVLRAIDVLLLFGGEAFGPILYGILRAFKDCIVELPSAHDSRSPQSHTKPLSSTKNVELSPTRGGKKKKTSFFEKTQAKFESLSMLEETTVPSKSTSLASIVEKKVEDIRNRNDSIRLYNVLMSLPKNCRDERLELAFSFAREMHSDPELKSIRSRVNWLKAASRPGNFDFPPKTLQIHVSEEDEPLTILQDTEKDEFDDTDDFSRTRERSLIFDNTEDEEVEIDLEDPNLTLDQFTNAVGKNLEHVDEVWRNIKALVSQNKRYRELFGGMDNSAEKRKT